MDKLTKEFLTEHVCIVVDYSEVKAIPDKKVIYKSEFTDFERQLEKLNIEMRHKNIHNDNLAFDICLDNITIYQGRLEVGSVYYQTIYMRVMEYLGLYRGKEIDETTADMAMILFSYLLRDIDDPELDNAIEHLSKYMLSPEELNKLLEVA